jgi:hypothetical protein
MQISFQVRKLEKAHSFSLFRAFSGSQNSADVCKGCHFVTCTPHLATYTKRFATLSRNALSMVSSVQNQYFSQKTGWRRRRAGTRVKIFKPSFPQPVVVFGLEWPVQWLHWPPGTQTWPTVAADQPGIGEKRDNPCHRARWCESYPGGRDISKKSVATALSAWQIPLCCWISLKE